MKRFSNPRKEGTPCDGDGKRKLINLGTEEHIHIYRRTYIHIYRRRAKCEIPVGPTTKSGGDRSQLMIFE